MTSIVEGGVGLLLMESDVSAALRLEARCGALMDDLLIYGIQATARRLRDIQLWTVIGGMAQLFSLSTIGEPAALAARYAPLADHPAAYAAGSPCPCGKHNIPDPKPETFPDGGCRRCFGWNEAGR
jgi:hypothetical protein